MNNICFISSGFQLLNAYEYSKSLSIECNYYAIYDSVDEKRQILNTANYLKIEKICLIRRVPVLTYLYLLLFFFIKAENFIFGNLLDNHMMVLSKLINYKNIILVDDGIATINNYKNYRLNNNIKNKYPERIIFFSIFDLGCNEFVVKNNFEFIFKSEKIISEKVYFIGQPMENILGEIEYYRVLSTVKKLNPNMIYIAHRRDSNKKLLYIGDMGITVLKMTEIIELYLIKSSTLPKKVISFYSTALITLKLLFKDEIIIKGIFNNDLISNDLIQIFKNLKIKSEI